MGTYSKNNFVTLPNLEFGVYNDVANFNIGMKALVLIYEKLNFPPSVHMLRGCNKYNIKRVNLVLWAKKMIKSDKLIEQEDFKYYLVDFIFFLFCIQVNRCSIYFKF